MTPYLRIACVARPHGVRGAIKLLPLTDDTARFHGLKQAYLERDGAYEPIVIHSASVRPDAVVVHIDGVEDKEHAERLRGVYICVDRQNAVQLPPGRYFIADLIGCTVEDTEGTAYGRLTDVLQTGANDVYVVQGEKNMLLPALKKVLLEVDVARGRILLDAQVVKEVALLED